MRSTALSLLTVYPGEDATRAFELALMDDEALIRRTAVQSIALSGLRRQTELIAPLLYDPVAAVRMEAAYSLSLLLVEMKRYGEALSYLERAAKGMPDRSRVQYNLGLLFQVLQRDTQAEAALQKTLGMEPANLDYSMPWRTSTSNETVSPKQKR